MKRDLSWPPKSHKCLKSTSKSKMATHYESSTKFLSNNDVIDSFDDSDFILHETELESLLSDLPHLVSDDECDVEFDPMPDASDVEIDPIPLYEISPRDGTQALVEYAASIDFFFPNNDTPVQEDVNRIQKTQHQANKKTKPKRATKKQKPHTRSGKKTVTKRKMSSKINYSSAVADLCPERDVVFGRGGHAVHNPGNGFLLDAVKTHSSEYKKLGKNKEGKEEKKHIIQLITAMVQARGGRFLLRQHKDKAWQEASDKKVHEKISHMLRDQPRDKALNTAVRCCC